MIQSILDARHETLNTIYTLAGTSKASIHSTIGDVAILSWNATHRVAQPEVKAAKFFVQLAKALELLGVKAAAAVFTGEGECEYVVTATGQQTLLLHTTWMDACTVPSVWHTSSAAC